jgi:hypothetical protein
MIETRPDSNDNFLFAQSQNSSVVYASLVLIEAVTSPPYTATQVIVSLYKPELNHLSVRRQRTVEAERLRNTDGSADRKNCLPFFVLIAQLDRLRVVSPSHFTGRQSSHHQYEALDTGDVRRRHYGIVHCPRCCKMGPRYRVGVWQTPCTHSDDQVYATHIDKFIQAAAAIEFVQELTKVRFNHKGKDARDSVKESYQVKLMPAPSCSC